MTTSMIIALLVTAFMIYLIMTDKVPFGAAPLVACTLMVLFGVTDIATAFRGFSNSSIVMLATFMVIIAALQKTTFITMFKRAKLDPAGFPKILEKYRNNLKMHLEEPPYFQVSLKGRRPKETLDVLEVLNSILTDFQSLLEESKTPM